MSTSSRSPVPPAEALLKALTRLLRPLVRLLMRGGVTYPVLADALRGLYVDVALRDLLPDEKTHTDSRVSLLTGVHRKELRRLRAQDAPAAEVPAVVTLSSQIVALWLGRQPYIDEKGQPAALHRTRAAGQPSFEELVTAVTSDVRPRAVLDEFLNQGIVSIESGDRVRLQSAGYVPQKRGEEQLFYFARNLHDHAAAAAANITAPGAPPFFDRSLHYDRLSPAAARQLDEAAREASMKLLLEMNRLALSLSEAEEPAGAEMPLRRVNLGVYLYVDDDGPRHDGPGDGDAPSR